MNSNDFSVTKQKEFIELISDLSYADESIEIKDESMFSRQVSIKELANIRGFRLQANKNTSLHKKSLVATGIFLEALFLHLKINYSMLQSVRITSKDGFSVELSEELLLSSSPFLALTLDDEPLIKNRQPARLIIANKSEMFWAAGIKKISFKVKDSQTANIEIKRLYLLDRICKNIQKEQMFKGNLAAIKISELFKGIETSKVVSFMASDSFAKNEELEMVLKSHLVLDDVRGLVLEVPDAPKRMSIKSIFLIKTGRVAFISLIQFLKYNKSVQFSDFGAIFDLVNFKNTAKYRLVSSNNKEMSVSREKLKSTQIKIDKIADETTTIKLSDCSLFDIPYELQYIEAIE